MSTEKAKRATIQLGELNLFVYQLPDGTYALSKRDLQNKLSIRVRNQTGKKYVQPLLDKHPEGVQLVPVEGTTIKAHLISLNIVTQIIQIYAKLGNQQCLAIAIASVAETLERRADRAFHIVRTEEERNLRFEVRRKGILSRTFWTDTIDAYMANNEVSENYQRFIYIHVSDCVNRALFGMSAKKVREHLGLKTNDAVRDALSTNTLNIIEMIEKMAATRVEQLSVEPKQALKDAIALSGITPDKARLN